MINRGSRANTWLEGWQSAPLLPLPPQFSALKMVSLSLCHIVTSHFIPAAFVTEAPTNGATPPDEPRSLSSLNRPGCPSLDHGWLFMPGGESPALLPKLHEFSIIVIHFSYSCISHRTVRMISSSAGSSYPTQKTFKVQVMWHDVTHILLVFCDCFWGGGIICVITWRV